MKLTSSLVVVFAGLLAASSSTSAAKTDVNCKSGLVPSSAAPAAPSAALTPVVTPAVETPAPAQPQDQEDEHPELTEAPVQDDPSTPGEDDSTEEEDTTPTMAPVARSAYGTGEAGSEYASDDTEEEIGGEADEDDDSTTPAPEAEAGGEADVEAITPAPEAEVGGEAESQTAQTSTAPQDGVDPASCLAAHNQLRAEVGLAPFIWDPVLAARGAAWAQRMEDMNFFDHHTPGQSDDQMNNLFSGTSCIEAVAAFASEKASFPADRIVREENYKDYGHYSMIVWHDTTRVGCGRGASENLVCYYETPGNIVGEAAY